MKRLALLAVTGLVILSLAGCQKYQSDEIRESWKGLTTTQREKLASEIVTLEKDPKLGRGLGIFCLLRPSFEFFVPEQVEGEEHFEPKLLLACRKVSATTDLVGLFQDVSNHTELSLEELAASEVLAKFDSKPELYLTSDYSAEVNYYITRAIEHGLWYSELPLFMDANDLKAVADTDTIVAGPIPPLFRLADGIGKLDGKHRSYYSLAPKKLWETLDAIAKKCGNLPDGTFRIDSLTRCSDYPLRGAAKDSSHCFGGACDIDLDRLSQSDKTILHQALYGLALEGCLGYYVEANTPSANGKFAVGHVPHDFDVLGQVHVIVNPKYEEVRNR